MFDPNGEKQNMVDGFVKKMMEGGHKEFERAAYFIAKTIQAQAENLAVPYKHSIWNLIDELNKKSK